MIECGMAELVKEGSSEVRNGILVRTEDLSQEVFFVQVREGAEVKLNVTQILKDFGWAPVKFKRVEAQTAALTEIAAGGHLWGEDLAAIAKAALET